MPERSWDYGYRPLIAAIDNLSEGYGKLWREMRKRIESNEFGADPSDADLQRRVSGADERLRRAKEALQHYSLEHLRSVGHNV